MQTVQASHISVRSIVVGSRAHLLLDPFSLLNRRQLTPVRKIVPLLAMPATEAENRGLINNGTITTLEGPEIFRKGDYLCKGSFGELWFQSGVKLETKYEASGTTSADGFQIWTPKPGQGDMAVKVESDCPFAIQANWGHALPDGTKVMAGNPGDYLLTNPNRPSDWWIVKGGIFDATYVPDS